MSLPSVQGREGLAILDQDWEHSSQVIGEQFVQAETAPAAGQDLFSAAFAQCHLLSRVPRLVCPLPPVGSGTSSFPAPVAWESLADTGVNALCRAAGDQNPPQPT